MRINDLARDQTARPATNFRQLYGVEIEVERCYSHSWTRSSSTYWIPVPDSSLRGGGVEFITKAIAMVDLKAAIEQFYKHSKKHRYHSNLRTSTHVHVDMRHRTASQVLAVCTLYALVEPLMMRMCGATREENIYCVPWYRASRDIARIVEALHTSNISDARVLLRNSCKYSALYLGPLATLGTIEFRSAPYFKNKNRMVWWLNTIEKLVEVGLEIGTARAVLARADDDLLPLLQSINPLWGIDDVELVGDRGSLDIAASLVRTSDDADIGAGWDFPFLHVTERSTAQCAGL